ncbi:unnamed protein product [Mytilus coruscus]|uniref:Uncharacterized protein n=1 Tax=Mytilus coruscus TaxID=42192 RepID=A0A6J8D0L8_MYTCO|nr:unnamed protein product [Mytilus coruscus]
MIEFEWISTEYYMLFQDEVLTGLNFDAVNITTDKIDIDTGLHLLKNGCLPWILLHLDMLDGIEDKQKENVIETHEGLLLDTDNSPELYELLPAVIQTLKNEGKMDSYVRFNRLLAGNKLPLKSIAFLLFKDVVSWYSLDDSHKMRYSPKVKQFQGEVSEIYEWHEKSRSR